MDSAFVFLFALEKFPHRPDGDPRYDLHLASFRIVKTSEGQLGSTYPEMTSGPKAAFAVVAEHCR